MENVECFFWHEWEGRRGANKIRTCLLKYLEKKAALVDDENLEFTLYSNKCCRQNRIVSSSH
jgi:hypothetical protein